MTPRAILCVDDQQLVHLWEEDLLSDYTAGGTRIVHAFHGLEALKKLVEVPEIDLVLLDINMPVLNGLAFLDQKQKTTFARIPVIVLTNEGDRPEEVAHAKSLGAQAVLAKPFSRAQLSECIESIEYGGGGGEAGSAE